MRATLIALLLMTPALWAAPLEVKEEPKKEETKKEEVKKDEAKTEEPKKDETKTDETKKAEPKKEEAPAEPEVKILDLPVSGKVSKASPAPEIRTGVGVRIKGCKSATATDVAVEVECWNGSVWKSRKYPGIKEGDLIGRLEPAKGAEPQLDFRTHWKLVSIGDEQERPADATHRLPRRFRVLSLVHEWAKAPRDAHSPLEGEMNELDPVKLPEPPPENERPPAPPGKPGP